MQKKILPFLLVFGLTACSILPTNEPLLTSPTSPTTPVVAIIAPTSEASLTSTFTPTPTDTPHLSPTISLTRLPRPTFTPLPTLTAGQPVTLRLLDMMNASTGWATESHGHILHTTDSASTWRDVTPSWGTYQPDGFFALDADQAWAVLSTDAGGIAHVPIWHTLDGGTTWQASQPIDVGGAFIDPFSIQFVDKSTGWAMINTDHFMSHNWTQTFQTTDGGNTWKWFQETSVNIGPEAFGVDTMGFLDAQTGWGSYSDIVFSAIRTTEYWWIQKTIDSGTTWHMVFLPAPSNLPEYFTTEDPWCGRGGINAIPPSTVDFLISCIFTDKLSAETIPGKSIRYHYHSGNAGQTWSVWQQTGDVQFINPAVGWQLYSPGPNTLGQLQKTTDGGQTWITIQKVAWPTVDLDFINEQVGWAIVTDSKGAYALVHTQDGGKTWVDVKAMVGP